MLESCSNDPKAYLSQDALLQQLQSASPPIVIDVRSTAEYQAGHIPTALHIPFLNALISSQLQNVSGAKPIVIYCEHGPRAGIAKWGLAMRGFENIQYLEGHMAAWRKAGLSLTPGKDKP